MFFGPCFDVFQIETEKIVPFDDVRIAPLNFLHQLSKHFGFVEFLAGNQPLPTRRI